MMLSKKIGIDLGTSTVLIYVKGEGIVVTSLLWSPSIATAHASSPSAVRRRRWSDEPLMRSRWCARCGKV